MLTQYSIIINSGHFTVYVGEVKESFAVHADLLRLHSGFFRERFEDFSDEAEHKLSTIKPAFFADFVAWLYTGAYLRLKMTRWE